MAVTSGLAEDELESLELAVRRLKQLRIIYAAGAAFSVFLIAGGISAWMGPSTDYLWMLPMCITGSFISLGGHLLAWQQIAAARRMIADCDDRTKSAGQIH